MARPRLALVPLDERPVNTRLVGDVVSIAGWDLELPPAAILPRFRDPADVEAIARWLGERLGDPPVRAAVVSLDTFVGGGLIPMRISHESIVELIGRLGALRDIASRHPEAPIAAISLVTRASDSYSAVEEPAYWDRFGRELHRLGADAHRAQEAGEPVESSVPAEIRHDFARRRLRNHTLTLAALELVAEGALARLDVTADDTAPYSAGSIEQEWLRYWARLDPALAVPVRPGADETGAVLAARMVVVAAGAAPAVGIDGDPAGWDRIPPFENAPLGESVSRQIDAAGGRRAEAGPGDVLLVVHAPDPARADHFGPVPPIEDGAAVADTVARIERGLAAGPVVVADVRYVNGGDAALARALRERGLLDRLAGYAGWNTAGNALGSAVAFAVVTAVGAERGTLDPEAARRALHRRLLDDVVYQAELRRAVADRLFGGSIGPLDAVGRDAAEEEIASRMRETAVEWGLEPPATVTLPWSRSFEIDVEFGSDAALRPPRR